MYSFSVRGGNVSPNTGSLRYVGTDSLYWSITTYPNTTGTYYLFFNSINIFLSYHGDRFYGFSVQGKTFVRGGYIRLDAGSLKWAGINNNYWSSTTYSNATEAYELHSSNTSVFPSDYGSRYHGSSVRGGRITLDTGSLRFAGHGSDYWSITTYPNATVAYSLHINNISIYPSNNYYRHFSFSVRSLSAADLSLYILALRDSQVSLAATGQLQLILMLNSHTTSPSIVSTLTHQTTVIDSTVSRCIEKLQLVSYTLSAAGLSI